MTFHQIRQRYLDFMREKGHVIVPSTALIPENDPTTLFTGSGMQPMISYLLGQEHPNGSRIANSQRCFRAEDIEEVGDNRHTTFFEMLGNWSFGDYFKKEQLEWISDFLFNQLKIKPEKIFVTCFIGDQANNLPKDIEAAEIWREIFKNKKIKAEAVDLGSEEDASKRGIKTDEKIFFYSSKKNWWSRAGAPDKMPVGEPGGPCSEMFYEFSHIPHDPIFGEKCHPNCDCGRFMEIGNNVFMAYKKTGENQFEELPKKNIDFGGGLERIAAAMNNDPDVFSAAPFNLIYSNLSQKTKLKKEYQELTKEEKFAFRIIADHIRAALFMVFDGVNPSNTDQGYFVRRLIRRAVRYSDILFPEIETISISISSMINEYKNIYPALKEKETEIIQILTNEEGAFRKTLQSGLREFNKLSSKSISGNDAFKLFSTYGFPIELTIEMAKSKKINVDLQGFRKKMAEHQEISRKGAEKKFKGGLLDNSEINLKYHTATHLLHQALKKILGSEVEQKGSNITPERLRFDFNYKTKITDNEKKQIEDLVNQQIKKALPITYQDLLIEDAKKLGAIGLFEEKYEKTVRIYRVGDFSLELCGGPHARNTSELGRFKIIKEEGVAAGIRRIKAILE